MTFLAGLYVGLTIGVAAGFLLCGMLTMSKRCDEEITRYSREDAKHAKRVV